jgi:hypothetical protein
MQLAEIHIHPLKSCRAQLVEQALVEPMGLQHDRRWMLIGADGQFMTGRQFPRLVLIEVAADTQGACFTAPDMPELRVEHADMNEDVPVEVWRSAFAARTGSWDADFWFSDFLGVACRLVYVDAHTTRRTHADPSVPVGFADGYPLLLIGTASLVDLNARLAQPVGMRQFRPNLVVQTGKAFVEDGWQRIRVGEVVFENVKPCARCIFTTVDPEQASLHPKQEPLATLNGYRRSEAGTLFGINLVARGTGLVKLGDTVEVLA